jgi:hypothetical protein
MPADGAASATADALEPWIGEVCDLLDLDRSAIDAEVVLDLARDVAHGVARPAAPLTTFLLGVAAGRGGADREGLRAIAVRIAEQVERRSARA